MQFVGTVEEYLKRPDSRQKGGEGARQESWRQHTASWMCEQTDKSYKSNSLSH